MKNFKNLLRGITALIVMFAPLSVATLFSPTLVSAGANQCSWVGAGGDNNWSTDANWICSVGTEPATGYDLIFPAGNGESTNNDLSALNQYAGIWTSDQPGCSGSTYVIAGNTILLAGDITFSHPNNCQVTLEINTSLTLMGNSTFNAYGNLSFVNGNGTLNIGAYSLDLISNSGFIYLGSSGSQLTGSGPVNFSGDGSFWVIRSNSSFTGSYTSSGQTTIGQADSLGSGAITLNAGGRLQYGTQGTGLHTITNDITVRGVESYGASRLTLNGDSSVAYPLGRPSTTNGYGAAYDSTNSVTLSGDMILEEAITIDMQVDTTLTGGLSGAYTVGNSYGTTGGGTMTISSSPNTSNTANGVYEKTSYVATLSDNLPANTLSITDHAEISITGTRSHVYVYDGGILKGSGAIGNLTSEGGILRPGLSPGIMNTGNLDFDSATTLDVELEGTSDGQHDRYNVTGTVSIGNAILSPSLFNGYAPSISDTFTIIANDGADAVVGTFAGLAQGATVNAGAYQFTISYNGGTGNDVVLTTTYVPGPPGTGFGVFKNSLVLPISLIAVGAGLFVYSNKRQKTLSRKRR